jgi:uncharacterized membrane protein YdbT with pleckstrin-like domain
MTYNPEAEKYANKQKEAAAKKEEEERAAKLEKETKEKKEAEAKKEAAEKAEKERIEKERSEFSFGRLFGRILNTVLIIVLIALLVSGAVYGASLATNLNVYKTAPFRIIYAIWGFFFFWVVIPYVWIYRRFWLGKIPRFYAILPLVPYRFNHPFVARFFDWITYNPIEVDELKEWIPK